MHSGSILGEVLAEVTRSDVVESVHAGHLVLLNADGSILFQMGGSNFKHIFTFIA
jgi:L-asparaginase II